MSKLKPMYPGKVNSPVTTLKKAVTADAITLSVEDISVFPDAPNLAVIGSGEKCETVRYVNINRDAGLLRDVERGFEGMAQSWEAGTPIARNFTNHDLLTVQENIRQLKQQRSFCFGSITASESQAGYLEIIIPIRAIPVERTNLVFMLEVSLDKSSKEIFFINLEYSSRRMSYNISATLSYMGLDIYCPSSSVINEQLKFYIRSSNNNLGKTQTAYIYVLQDFEEYILTTNQIQLDVVSKPQGNYRKANILHSSLLRNLKVGSHFKGGSLSGTQKLLSSEYKNTLKQDLAPNHNVLGIIIPMTPGQAPATCIVNLYVYSSNNSFLDSPLCLQVSAKFDKLNSIQAASFICEHKEIHPEIFVSFNPYTSGDYTFCIEVKFPKSVTTQIPLEIAIVSTTVDRYFIFGDEPLTGYSNDITKSTAVKCVDQSLLPWVSIGKRAEIITAHPESFLTIGWDNNPNGKVNINMLRHHFESYPTRVTGDASSPNTIKVKIPIGLKDLTKDIHISGKIMFFHEDFPIVGGNPRPTILNQPLVIDFSVICQSKTRVIGGHFMCEHKKIRPELYVPHDGITDDKLSLLIKIEESQLALMKSRSLLATFDLLAHSDGDKIQIQNQYKYNNNYSFDAEYLNLTSGFFNANYSHPLEDCSLFQLSVDGKKKIADAINGKTGNSSANANMSFDELKDEIVGLWVDKEERMTTDGNPFDFSTNDLKSFIAANKNRMVKYPHITDTQNVTNMSTMFYGCSKLTTVPLFNTQNVTNMSSMFDGCTNLTTVPLFNTQNVTNMSTMFYGCSKLTTVPLFNTQNVTKISGMFNGCSKLTTVPLFNTQNVTGMNFMFDGCTNLTTVPLFNTQNVTGMNFMFRNCTNLEFVPKLNTSKVTTFSNMFAGCTSLNISRMRAVGWEEKFLRTAPNYTAP